MNARRKYGARTNKNTGIPVFFTEVKALFQKNLITPFYPKRFMGIKSNRLQLMIIFDNRHKNPIVYIL